jgi:hypothetical protein
MFRIEATCKDEQFNGRQSVKSFIDMDVDLGVIIKAPVVQHKSFDNSINTSNNDLLGVNHSQSKAHSNDSKDADRKDLNNIEMTTNQDQDTGYQTGISSTQFNMMDLTSHQESINMATTTATKEPILSLSSLQDIDKHIKKEKEKLVTPTEKAVDFYKESLTLSLTSFTNLYPLGE